MSEKTLHIGIDDTDSLKGMCTTYIGALLADELSKYSEIKRQKLVRLNPNIPWKTRGNAAVAIEIETREGEKAKAEVLRAVEGLSELEDEGTNPGVVFFRGAIPADFRRHYYNALHRIVRLEEAEEMALRHGAELHKFKNGRGVIGALAAIGADLEDHTHEVIAYRPPENSRKERKIDAASVFEMDRATYPQTFNNVDREVERVLIAPHTPCPVLFGIRGENKEVLRHAFGMVRVGEPIERVAHFKTNQCTDAHLEAVGGISEIEPYSSVIAEGRVASKPRTIKGGHVIFALSDGSTIDCAAYEPTGSFRNTVKALLPGDAVRVCGGVRAEPLTINLEKLEILDLIRKGEQTPVCGKCGKRMESAGKEQGYRCRSCKTSKKERERVEIKRDVEEGIYQVPPRAMRHLGKPLVRGR